MKIADYISQAKITVSPRFDFQATDSYPDLVELYKLALSKRGKEFQSDSQLLGNLKSVAKWIESGNTSLLLIGSPGTGKTITTSVVKMYIEAQRGRNQYGVWIPEYCVGLFSASDLYNEARENKLSDKPKKVRYAAIDDLGSEPGATAKVFGADINPIIDIVHSRYNEQKVTILSSNLSMTEIEKAYGARFADRLYEQYDRVIFNYDSFRRAKSAPVERNYQADF